jgi:flagellar secretion chaperone FliS
MVANSYARTYRANAVLTASPGQLVLMLYDGALKALALATQAFEETPANHSRFAVINHQLLKAQRILAELQGGLNMEEGGDFAQTMNRLYDYYNRRLFEANLRKQPDPVREVEGLLREVRNAWAEMLGKNDLTTPLTMDRVHEVA